LDSPDRGLLMLFSRPDQPRCLRCKSDRVYRSSPKPGDFLYTLILQIPVRCQACYTRFGTWYRPGEPKPNEQQEKPTATPSGEFTIIRQPKKDPPKD
jgi:hypothetical protein